MIQRRRKIVDQVMETASLRRHQGSRGRANGTTLAQDAARAAAHTTTRSARNSA